MNRDQTNRLALDRLLLSLANSDVAEAGDALNGLGLAVGCLAAKLVAGHDINRRRIEELERFIREMAQKVHQGHHTVEPSTWLACHYGICVEVRHVLGETA